MQPLSRIFFEAAVASYRSVFFGRLFCTYLETLELRRNNLTYVSQGDFKTRLEDEDVEQVYNILQWYGTVVIDMREGDVERLAESWVCPDIAAWSLSSAFLPMDGSYDASERLVFVSVVSLCTFFFTLGISKVGPESPGGVGQTDFP